MEGVVELETTGHKNGARVLASDPVSLTSANNRVLFVRLGFLNSTGGAVWPSCDEACVLVRWRRTVPQTCKLGPPLP